jgi:hypothetical protein
MDRLRWTALPLLLVAVAVASSVAAAQEASFAPQGSATPGPPLRDLYLDMPYYLGGYEPEIVMTRGREHIAGLAADDPTRIELEAFLDELGAGIEDMDSGYAAVSLEGFFGFVVAIRIDGVEPGSLAPAYLPLLIDDLVDPSVDEGTVGDKDVLIVSSVGDGGEPVDLYVYDGGHTLWMLQGPTDVIESTLANLR